MNFSSHVRPPDTASGEFKLAYSEGIGTVFRLMNRPYGSSTLELSAAAVSLSLTLVVGSRRAVPKGGCQIALD